MENNTPNKDLEYIQKIVVTGIYPHIAYTQWYSNKITTKEFIKILDDYTKNSSSNTRVDTSI